MVHLIIINGVYNTTIKVILSSVKKTMYVQLSIYSQNR